MFLMKPGFEYIGVAVGVFVISDDGKCNLIHVAKNILPIMSITKIDIEEYRKRL